MEKDLFHLLIGVGPVVKMVLIILYVFSIVSWAIILWKYLAFRRIKRQSKKFMEIFRGTTSPEAIMRDSRVLSHTPLSRIFRAGYGQLRKQGSIDILGGVLREAVDTELENLEKYLGFLATTGSATPFIGLFGTVWGIMNSFHGIGKMGSASLAVVAPGISEALIATAVGLAVAIPAVIAYNYFGGKVRVISSEIERFSIDIQALLTPPENEAD